MGVFVAIALFLVLLVLFHKNCTNREWKVVPTGNMPWFDFKKVRKSPDWKQYASWQDLKKDPEKRQPFLNFAVLFVLLLFSCIQWSRWV